jgi:hypothetical protein
MPRVGFEPTIPVFEQAKTVHAVDSAATVTGTPVGKEDTKLNEVERFCRYILQ